MLLASPHHEAKRTHKGFPSLCLYCTDGYLTTCRRLIDDDVKPTKLFSRFLFFFSSTEQNRQTRVLASFFEDQPDIWKKKKKNLA